MLLDVELSVLRGFLTDRQAVEWKQNIYSTADVGPLLEALMQGDFRAVLLDPRVLDLLRGDDAHAEGQDIEAHLERQVLLYLSGASEHTQRNRELLVLVLAVSCLQMFAQSNWTGPPVSVPVSDLLPRRLLEPQSVTEVVHSSLLLDGEAVYSLVANPLLLLLARVILTKCSSKMDSLQLLPWWTLRYVHLHQQILEARSPQLFSLAQSSMDKVVKRLSLLSEHTNLTLQFHLECVYANLTYYEYQAAKEHLRTAQQLSGLSISTTGALGKRTRFQQNHLAQLILEVKKNQNQTTQTDDDASPAPTDRARLPKDLNLDDDTVLDQMDLADPDQYQLPELSAEEQAVVLGVCTDFQRNNPVHKLTAEELLAFTSCILGQPKFWAVEVTALSLRTKLERGRTRCVERAMMQTQAIADHFEDVNCPVTERLKVFYCVQVPTRWAIQKLLASLLSDLGCTSSALLVYERLELWEDAVICYERLGQHGKAEEIIRRELERKETPGLYCLLGDVLREQRFYDRAWELSGGRSARAMRSKALLHLHHHEIQQCVDCFEESLRINGMQLGVWFSLGCAYFSLEGYEGAARAFQRCVTLEPDNAEAWNNLSTAYIRLRKKDKAFLTLQEALKCNFEHWQIWENFIAVSVDIGEFAEAIKTYHRLMDLRDNYKDVEILQILVRAVVENMADRHGVAAQTLASPLKELLGRVSSRHSADAEVWRQYALLYGGGRSDDRDDNDKALHFLSKAHRCELQSRGWDSDPVLFKEVIDRGVNLARVCLSVSCEKTNPAEALQTLSSIRLSLRSLATKAKQMHTDVSTGQIHAELRDGVDALEQMVTELTELSGKMRTQATAV